MKDILKIALFLTCMSTMAQRGYKHLNLDAGINLEGNYSYNLALELNKGSFSAWEIALEAHLSPIMINKNFPVPNPDPTDTDNPTIDNYRSVPFDQEVFLAGVYYKPLIKKNKNMVYNFRYGLVVGTSKGFVLGAGAGFEATYHFKGLFGVFLKQSNHYIINVPNRFRHSLHAGVKIPL